MSPSVQSLRIPDVKVFSFNRFDDERGFFAETYHRDRLAQEGVTIEFVQDNQSFSKVAPTLRGLHLQAPPFAQAKLVRVTRGSILDVCVDVRLGSPYFGQWVAVEISAALWNQILVPVGFLHGFVTREPETEVHYKVSAHYHQEAERGVIWNDSDLQIDWNVAGTPILSPKDAALPLFRDFRTPFIYENPSGRNS